MVSKKNLKPSLTPIQPTAILTGPTASGKTSLALRLAETHGQMEIINADSLLVYRRMDIGTAKPTAEELAQIPHHLIDICDPSETFSAGDFVRHTHAAIRNIESRGKRALIVGGTGFYLKALLKGLWETQPADLALRAELEKRSPDELYKELQAKDPVSALRISTHDHYRVIRALEIIHLTGKTPTELQREHELKSAESSASRPFSLWIIDRETAVLDARIQLRTEQMLEAGFVDEVKSVLKQYPDSRALDSVGYRQVKDFLTGNPPTGRKIAPGIEGLRQEIELATRQLVKRQRTWFKSQTEAEWFYLPEAEVRLATRFKEIYGNTNPEHPEPIL
ncbi:MAG: tRNA (adenosine(37)-N6)-dimethylallyltransferase MiaA [Methylotenera sp.]|nr:tRNA (adenosine(37)-N6)-dimethylallyltransferase MiaA [Oligoflexia bacterium]